jgi:hypothetical protein
MRQAMRCSGGSAVKWPPTGCRPLSAHVRCSLRALTFFSTAGLRASSSETGASYGPQPAPGWLAR